MSEMSRVEAERDSAQHHLAYHLKDFRPGADMEATGDLAVDMAHYAERMRDERDAARARSADMEARIRDGMQAAFSGDEFEENAQAAAGEGEWSWFRWLALDALDGALLDAAPAGGAEEVKTGWECGPHTNAWGGHDARCRRAY